MSTPLLGLAAVIGLAAGLRLHELGARSLWIDELFSVGLAVQDLRTTLAVLYGEEANMALYYAIMHLWLGLVGAAPSEVLARLPSVVFGLASLWALYLVGTELDHPLSGLLAALLGAVNAYHVGMSQEARAYTLWALCAALAWLALLRALGGGGRPAWAAYALTTALALYSHFFTVFIVFAQIVFVGLRGRWSELRALALSAMGAAALCLPFVPFFVLSHEGSQILHVRPNAPRDLLDLFRLYAGGSTLLLGAYIVLGGLGVAVGWLGSGDWRGRVRRGAPVFWLLVPVVTAFLVSYVKPVFKERYLFAASWPPSRFQPDRSQAASTPDRRRTGAPPRSTCWPARARATVGSSSPSAASLATSTTRAGWRATSRLGPISTSWRASTGASWRTQPPTDRPPQPIGRWSPGRPAYRTSAPAIRESGWSWRTSSTPCPEATPRQPSATG